MKNHNKKSKIAYARVVDIMFVLMTIILCSILFFQYNQKTNRTIDTREERYFRSIDEKTDLIFGNPDADLFIVEYGDLECPYCREFHSHAKNLIKSTWGTSGKVAWVWRNGFHINETSVEKAKVLECIKKHGGENSRIKAWNFIEESLSGGVYEIIYPVDRYKNIFNQLNLPSEKIESCRKNNETYGKILKDIKDIDAIGITETPHIQLISGSGELVFETVGALTSVQLEEFISTFFKSLK